MKKFIVMAIFAQILFNHTAQAQEPQKESVSRKHFLAYDSIMNPRRERKIAKSEVKKETPPVNLLAGNKIMCWGKEDKINPEIILPEKRTKGCNDSLKNYLLSQNKKNVEPVIDSLKKDLSNSNTQDSNSKSSKGLQGPQGPQGSPGKPGENRLVSFQIPTKTVSNQTTILNASNDQIVKVEKAILNKLQHDSVFASEFSKNLNLGPNSKIAVNSGTVGQNGSLTIEQLNQLKDYLTKLGLIGVILHPTKEQMDQAIKEMLKDSASAFKIGVALNSATNGKFGLAGISGKDGKNGVDGKPGRDGIDGKNGVDGKNGINGKDGSMTSIDKNDYSTVDTKPSLPRKPSSLTSLDTVISRVVYLKDTIYSVRKNYTTTITRTTKVINIDQNKLNQNDQFSSKSRIR